MGKSSTQPAPKTWPIFSRILIKISGEALLGKRKYGIEASAAFNVMGQVKQVIESGTEVALVIGAGNIFRGLAAAKYGMDRATADYMGMLATVINGMALQDAAEKLNLDTRLMSAIDMQQVAEPFIRRRAIRHMEKGRSVILGGGTGSPFYTTDTTAALRALELGCDAVFKGTKVDGVYDQDPQKYPSAKRYDELTYMDILTRPEIRVMDKSAISLCSDNDLPIAVFNLFIPGNLKRATSGEAIGTLVRNSQSPSK